MKFGTIGSLLIGVLSHGAVNAHYMYNGFVNHQIGKDKAGFFTNRLPKNNHNDEAFNGGLRRRTEGHDMIDESGWSWSVEEKEEIEEVVEGGTEDVVEDFIQQSHYKVSNKSTCLTYFIENIFVPCRSYFALFFFSLPFFSLNSVYRQRQFPFSKKELIQHSLNG